MNDTGQKTTRRQKREQLPLSEKLLLTVSEAAAYSGLPISTVKALVKSPDCPFRLAPPSKGKLTLIKRKKFEEYIENNEL